MTDPRAGRINVNAVGLSYFEWGEQRAGEPSTLLVHATGFHGRLWDQCARHLSGHVVALESRGHGRSDKIPPYTWEVFGSDVAAFVVALDLRQIVAAGHSMGGHCIVQAAARHPSRFARLVLIDPVMMSPEAYAAHAVHGGVAGMEDHPTARRRNHWRDADEMFARFAGRMPFAGWQQDVLRDYCNWGVLPNPDATGDDNRFVLACPPEVEASVYMGSGSRNILALVEALTLPVTVLRGRTREGARQGAMDFSGSPTWPELAAHFQQGTDVYLPDRSHFIPMEDPAQVAGYIAGGG